METLLAIIAIVQQASGKRLFAQLLSHIVIITGLLLVTAMMISAMLIGGMINAHIALLSSGMSPPIALLIIGAASLFIIAMLITVILWRLRSLRRIPRTLCGRSPFASCAMDTLDAFTADLMAD